LPAPAEILTKKIADDLAQIWGEMAVFMIKKRFSDVGATPETATEQQTEKIIDLLRENTLTMTLGREKAAQKALIYKRWAKEMYNGSTNGGA
jgi:hypothetical protein